MRIGSDMDCLDILRKVLGLKRENLAKDFPYVIF